MLHASMHRHVNGDVVRHRANAQALAAQEVEVAARAVAPEKTKPAGR
jgi:hypothetical protein